MQFQVAHFIRHLSVSVLSLNFYCTMRMADTCKCFPHSFTSFTDCRCFDIQYFRYNGVLLYAAQSVYLVQAVVLITNILQIATKLP
jgi:hypothetical protein